jgi:plastocyanin
MIAIPHRRTATRSGLIAVIIVLVVAACDGGDGASNETMNGDAGTSGDNEVVMQDLSFQPGDITVEVGTEVTWTNEDGVTHTTTSEDTAWDSGDLSSGETFSHTFDVPGSYAYVCDIHPTMQATVTVEE